MTISVITPATTTALTSLASVKTDLGITSSTDDAKLERFITQASAAIVDACGRGFGLETVAETFRFRDRQAQSGRPVGPPLVLSRDPVVSIASVVENGVTLDPADYENDGGRLYRLSSSYRVWWGCPAVIVTYTAGYVLPGDGGTRTLPESLEALCIRLVAAAYSSPAAPGVKSETVEGVGRIDYFASAGMGADDIQAALVNYVSRGW